jgi:hypothetical protein
MTFARDLGPLTRQERTKLKKLALTAPWRDIPARRYDTADVTFWEPCSRAFFIRIPPKGEIHRHHDAFIPGTTHHLVFQTNEGCENWWIDDEGKERQTHLTQAHRYWVDRTPMHWAYNHGNASRIHLLVEYP